MIIKLSPRVKKEIFDVLEEFGYESEKDFIEDALRRRILELKKADFLANVKEIREKLTKKKLRKEDLLKDFDRFYHRK